MKKKTPPPKNQKLRYETDKLVRWNMCQKIAKMLYQSTQTYAELEMYTSEISDHDIKSCN